MINKTLTRTKLTEGFTLWEEDFPVEKWEVAGIRLWPLIKKNIYFSLFVHKAGENEKKEKHTFLKKAFTRVQQLIQARLYLKSLNLKRATFLFCSSYEQRILFKEKEFNRFLEPLMDELEKNGGKSYFFEYPIVNHSEANRPDRIIDVRKLLVLFSDSSNRHKYQDELGQLDGFSRFLEEVFNETGIDNAFIKRKIIKNILAIKSWEGVFTKLIEITQPKFVLGLVYYSNPIYGLNLAANKLGVHSIDLQHGGLGPAHPAYYFSKAPKEGYNMLPNTFWTWNKSSYQDINKWAINTPHKVIIGGNPWIGYLNEVIKNTKGGLEKKKPVILFTLQPVGDIISSYFVEVILKTKDIFNWWLRFHPRMTEMDKNGVLDKFERNGNLKNIEYTYATLTPLPVVLNECDLHISQSSGSIIEAAMMNKYSLIIDETGVNYYSNIIEDGCAEPCLNKDKDEIIQKIRTGLDKGSSDDKQSLIDYRETLDSLIKQ